MSNNSRKEKMEQRGHTHLATIEVYLKAIALKEGSLSLIGTKSFGRRMMMVAIVVIILILAIYMDLSKQSTF
jgi:hypothetical protein